MRKISEDTLNLIQSILPETTRIEETYHIKIVTPMWGGGYKSRMNDETKLVRETSIRGQLRFWFRATSGVRYETPKNLFEKEKEIFGTTDRPSSLVVRVSELNFTKEDKKSYGDLCPKGELSTFGYVLFPFQNEYGRTASFDLTLSYPKEYENEINFALWAWLNFGGIGARTRRGCGALFCKQFAPDYKENAVVWSQFLSQDFVSKTLEKEKTKDWSTFVSRTFYNAQTRDWSTLGGGTFINPANLKAGAPLNTLDVWEKAIEDYKFFRQGLGFAREKEKDGSPGLSRWPEADAIRELKGSWSQGHEPHKDRPISFPRAELGLPIRFRFEDVGDPEDFDLLPVVPGGKYNRASSPIIVKPLVFSTNVGAPCVVFLNGSNRTRVTQVRLQGERGRNESVVDVKNARYQDSPLGKYSPQRGSALEGFKNYVLDRGYKSVTDQQ